MIPPEKIKLNLKKALSGKIPGKDSHLKMIPPERQLEVKPEQKSLVKESSVLIILYPANEEIHCILIKRPATMKNHAGQIAFPGGVIEKSDANPLTAAIREANEEVGINPDSIEIIGQLSSLYISVSLFQIAPFIGWCNSIPKLKQNYSEVDKIIHFPLSKLLKEGKISQVKIKTSTGILEVPCYNYKDEIIWGATAMILTELIDIIKSFYIREELH